MKPSEFLAAWTDEPVSTLPEEFDSKFVGVGESRGRVLAAYADTPDAPLSYTPVTTETREEFWKTVKAGALAYAGYNSCILGMALVDGVTCVAYDAEKLKEELAHSFDDSDRTVPKIVRVEELFDRLVRRDLGEASPWFLTLIRK